MTKSLHISVQILFGYVNSQFFWIVSGILLAQTLSVAVWLHVWRSEEHDFFVFYSGGRLGLNGQNPYGYAGMREEIHRNHDLAGRSRDSEVEMFFNPPEALVVFAPFSKLPWKYASWSWLSVQTSLALGLACLSWTFGGDGRPRWLGPVLVLESVP